MSVVANDPAAGLCRSFKGAPSTGLGQSFKQAMRRLASTVTIVSLADAEGRAGMTATAVTSLTAEPPALLVAVNRAASIHRRLSPGAAFCVNLMGAGHEAVSRAFGGGVPAAERFGVGDWRDESDGAPWLFDAEANLFCRVDEAHDYATHTIVIGKVDRVRLRSEGAGDPLLYAGGQFLSLMRAA